MSNYDKPVTQGFQRIKQNKGLVIQGQNSKLESFYSIWKGITPWSKYTVRFPNGDCKVDRMLSINLPRYISRTWANNYANENTTITIANEKGNDHLQRILRENKFYSRFNNFTDMFMGVGIAAIVVDISHLILDTESNTVGISPNSKIKLNFIDGRRVIPLTQQDGEITECAFMTFGTTNARITYHYLNEHNEYSIAYLEGVGKDGRYKWDCDGIKIIETDSVVPFFTIWHPNFADDEGGSGCNSVYEYAMDAFKQCDMNYTAFYKEIRLGQKVKFISADLNRIDNVKDSEGNVVGQQVEVFNPDDESIIAIGQGEDGKNMMSELNGELRVQQIVNALNFNMNVACMLCGLGQSTFEFGEGGRPLQTATAVIAKQTDLYRNVVKQENFATDNIRKMVLAIGYLNDFFFNEKINVADENDIEVIYDDNLVEDTSSKKQQELVEVQAGVMSIAEFRSHWYDQDEKSAITFLQDNAMLVVPYLSAVESGLLPIEHFIEIVYGQNYKYKNELIEYFNKKNQPVQFDDNYDDENEAEDIEDNEESKEDNHTEEGD